MKITITANTYSITSDIKVEDIKLLEKYNPNALKLFKEDGEERFRISYNPNVKSCISTFGITFGAKTLNGDAKAAITGTLPNEITAEAAAKEYVAEQLGSAFKDLKELEEKIPEAVATIKENKKTIIDAITIS